MTGAASFTSWTYAAKGQAFQALAKPIEAVWANAAIRDAIKSSANAEHAAVAFAAVACAEIPWTLLVSGTV